MSMAWHFGNDGSEKTHKIGVVLLLGAVEKLAQEMITQWHLMVRTGACDGVVSVDNRYDSRKDRYVLAGKAIRVAGAIEIFMMMEDRIRGS